MDDVNRFRKLIEDTKAGYFRIDMEGRFQQVNEAWLQMHGYSSPDEIIGKHFSVTQVEADLEKAQKIVERLLSGEVLPSDEFSRRCKDGSTGYHAYSVVPVKRYRKVVGLEGFLIDITDRRKAEEEFRFHSEIMKNIMEGISLIRLEDGLIVYANPKFEKMFGYGPGEMIGKDVAIVNAPTDKTPEETKKAIIDILVKRGEWHGEVENIKKDGTRFWCYANVSLFDHPEFGRAVVSVHTDITERRKAEEKLLKSEEKYRQLHESITDAIAVVDMQGRLREFNKAYQSMLGYSQADLLNLTYVELTPEKWHADEAAIVKEQVLRRGYSDIYQKEYRKKDGTIFPVEVRTLLIKDKTDNPVAIWAIVRDITERKKAEEEREKLILELKEALANVRQLSGMLPICASCKQIRDDQGYWKTVEAYITDHSEAVFTSGICPDCEKKMYEELEKLKNEDT